MEKLKKTKDFQAFADEKIQDLTQIRGGETTRTASNVPYYGGSIFEYKTNGEVWISDIDIWILD